MGGISYDLRGGWKISSLADVEIALNEIAQHINAMSGEQPDGTFITYINGLGGSAYMKFDPVTNVLSFFIEDTEHGRMNVS